MPGELGNMHRRAGGQPVRLPRTELHRRRRLRLGDGRHRRVDRRARSSASTTPSSPAASTATWAPSSFVKFCKIGALSATGTRPFDDGADGFVMGEGAALFLLKRLGRRRTRRRPHLRRAARHRRRQRRQGQGDHRAEPGRPAARRGAGLGERRAVARRRAR